MPLLIKTELKGDAGLFGLAIGAIGFGAVLGALFLTRIRKKFSPGQLVATASLLLAVVFIIPAFFKIAALVILTCTLFGVCWISVLSTFNVSAQMALPDWVRARGLAIYLMVFFGSMSLGSIL